MEVISFFALYKPLFAIAHVLSVVTGMGAALSADFLSVKYGFNRKLSREEISTLRFLARIVTIALVCVVCTGATLFLSDPQKYLASAKFLTKMTVVSVLCINGYFLHHYVFSHLADRGIFSSARLRALRQFAFGFGAISITSWVTALGLGVLLHIPISYEEALVVYIAVIVIAVAFSQFLEWYLLERGR
jgi:hypothetical protein